MNNLLMERVPTPIYHFQIFFLIILCPLMFFSALFLRDYFVTTFYLYNTSRQLLLNRIQQSESQEPAIIQNSIITYSSVETLGYLTIASITGHVDAQHFQFNRQIISPLFFSNLLSEIEKFDKFQLEQGRFSSLSSKSSSKYSLFEIQFQYDFRLLEANYRKCCRSTVAPRPGLIYCTN